MHPDSKHKLGARAGKFKLEARAGKHKLEARVGKYKLGTRVGKYKLRPRAGKYKLGARAGKYKLGTRAGARAKTGGQAKGRGPGNTKTRDKIDISYISSKRSSKKFCVSKIIDENGRRM